MNVRVSLSDALNDFVESRVASGRYASASEPINGALRRLEPQQQDHADV